jgi:hypothetical protein
MRVRLSQDIFSYPQTSATIKMNSVDIHQELSEMII